MEGAPIPYKKHRSVFTGTYAKMLHVVSPHTWKRHRIRINVYTFNPPHDAGFDEAMEKKVEELEREVKALVARFIDGISQLPDEGVYTTMKLDGTELIGNHDTSINFTMPNELNSKEVHGGVTPEASQKEEAPIRGTDDRASDAFQRITSTQPIDWSKANVAGNRILDISDTSLG